ncbi:nucleotidyl transferase AbiEii/AbiGii toxin family protein [Arthrobacter pigmenti]
MDDVLADVLESAARLQQLVPDAVLVGGSAAAMYAGHPLSFDHGHVLINLQEHFDVVLEALESENGWATNRTTYGKIILGELGGIETGLRQLIRICPLEVDQVVLPSGKTVRVPTLDETLRIKAFLITRRNQTRDYLDVAALAEKAGLEHAASVLSAMDSYYADQNRDGTAVTSQVIRQLSNPQPKDSRTTTQLEDYKGLKNKWRDWATTVEVCRKLALLMIQQDG